MCKIIGYWKSGSEDLALRERLLPALCRPILVTSSNCKPGGQGAWLLSTLKLSIFVLRTSFFLIGNIIFCDVFFFIERLPALEISPPFLS